MAPIPLDHAIKSAVASWREAGYQGVSPVTQRLLEFWFLEEHWLKNGSSLQFWRAQREAIESLIYIYEVCRYHSLYTLSRGFGVSISFDPTTDNWPKYCFKMATGSGKTFVMALAMVWQYFNCFFGTQNGCRYTSKFLLIAPNLIVLDRLNEAFEDNAIFRDFPFIPPEWEADFDLQLVYQSQVTAPHAFGTLYLTNVQQLYEDKASEPVNAIHEALGPYVVKGQPMSRVELERALSQHPDLLVLNDEAHHVHSDDLEWARAIARLDGSSPSPRAGRVGERGGQRLVMQLDFSATPYTGAGDRKAFFPHIIYDYPLAAAIRDGVVKRPKIGEIEHAVETGTNDYVERNRLQIDTGVEVFRQFQHDLKPAGKKPVLFVMTDQTRNADKVGKYLEDTQARRVYEPANVVRVDPDKLQYDFSIPTLAGGITRDVRRIADLDIVSLPKGLFRWDEIAIPRVMYREKDLLTQQTELERELSFDYTDRYEAYLANITKAILAQCGASAHFAEVVPKVKRYIEQCLFDRPIDLSDSNTVRKLNHLQVRAKIRDVFADAIRKLQAVEEPCELAEEWQVSQWNDGKAFHTSEPVYPAKKTVFAAGEREGLPYPRNSEYERHFMRYLDEQGEVVAYTRVLPRMPLRIPYIDAKGYLRHYTPDFVVKTEQGYLLIETKGEGWDKHEDAAAKVWAATHWCRKVSELTGESWRFVKILQPDFERFWGLPFSQLLSACQS